MPNENYWNKNQRGFNQDWDDNDNRYNRNRSNEYDDNFDNRRSDRSQQNRGNYGGSSSGYNQEGNNRNRQGYGNNDYNDDRYMGDNDYSNNRAAYGNSTGVNRGSSNYSDRSNDDWNRGNRRYSGSDFGYGNDRNRSDRDRGNDRDWWDKTKDEVSSWFGDDDAQRRRRNDEMRAEHKGKGPKGYTRSDERIKEDVNDKLSDDSYVDASDIEVTVNNCEVTLTGTVRTRGEKRHAEDLVESISGVKNVENRLRVSSSTGFTDSDILSTGNKYGSSGAAPVGAFDTRKNS